MGGDDPLTRDCDWAVVHGNVRCNRARTTYVAWRYKPEW